MVVVLVGGVVVSLGLAPSQADLVMGTAGFVEGRVGDDSVWVVLHRECHRLFPDEMFSDLFAATGRRSVPPRIVAVVMVLQRLFGLSDREAVEAFCFDARWKYACGGLDFDYPGFAHTVLVDMRARLARSERPKRIFEVTVEAASAAGLVGAKRVLDSTPLYDAVATMDTVTLVRSAMRGLLRFADDVLAAELREVFSSGDEYATSAKPQIDWDDPVARDGLVDSRARDAYAVVTLLDGRELVPDVAEAAVLLATVVGQDLEETGDGVFRIARRVAKDRVISTVDVEARHGHKTAARRFDGYKGHIAVDPDTEIITDTAVSAANAGDASVAADLIDDLVEDLVDDETDPSTGTGTGGDHDDRDDGDGDGNDGDGDGDGGGSGRVKVYGDAAYGTGKFLDTLARSHIESGCKTQPPVAPGGRFAKDRFDIDLEADTVTCPNAVTVTIRRGRDGDGIAWFADACAGCPLRCECTNAAGGRRVTVGRYEHRLAAARRQQHDPDWVADYRATRPKVERKLGHLMRRRHGGRRARVRGRPKVDADFNLLAAAHNLARLAVLGLHFEATTGWATTG
jgi:hypothetical protein